MTGRRRKQRTDVPGHIYVLPFAEPYPAGPRPRHYVGWSENGVWERLVAHATGKGNPLVAAVTKAGIAWWVASVFPRHEGRRATNQEQSPPGAVVRGVRRGVRAVRAERK